MTRTSHKSPPPLGNLNFRPQVVELESRVTPARYYVELQSPFEGKAGSTAASHSGGLMVNPSLPIAHGKAVVGASSPADAVRGALQGTVTVSIGGESVGYTFGRSTAGLTEEAQRPFVVEMKGKTGKVWLEDLAGLPQLGCDWDYNDRSWHVTVQAFDGGGGKGSHGNGGGGVGTFSLIDSDDWVWTDSMGQTAKVEYEITDSEYGYWTWRYTVTNNNLSVSSKNNYGISSIEIPAEVDAEVYDVEVVSGVTGWETASDYPYWYHANSMSFIAPGNKAVFQFKTPPSPILEVTGTALVAATPPMAAGGPAKGPGKAEILITNSTGAVVTADGTMKVAKWHDAFKMNAAGTDVVVNGPATGSNYDFIDRDDDRYNVWVYDKAAWDAKDRIEVKISTSNVAGFTMYDDAATVIDLVKFTGSGKAEQGWFWSDSQMLVSNEIDDVYSDAAYLAADEAAPGALGLLKVGHRWKISDRTHRIALRGTLKAEYEVVAGQANSAIKVERVAKVTKNVKVHVTILNVVAGGNPVITEANANARIHTANEKYAQVGILLIPNYQIKDPPEGVILGDFFDGYTYDKDGKVVLSAENIALLGDTKVKLRTEATDDIELYFVNRVVYPPDPTIVTGGISFPEADVEAKYADSVVMSADISNPFSVPHEIGHVLLNTINHYSGTLKETRLMVGVVGETDSVTGPRRLTTGEEADMLTKRPNLLTGP